ncbi:MAG TPA: hypothetical protein VK439_00725 [Rubrivivax sp.]|nr:hypothetical protein [Rubrivivax sp.]
MMDQNDDYRPLSRRRRLLIVVLAVCTAVTVVLMLLERPGAVQHTRQVQSAPLCKPGEDQGCVGGKVDVILSAPVASTSASAPVPASAGR